jgi:hypothetical protein
MFWNGLHPQNRILEETTEKQVSARSSSAISALDVRLQKISNIRKGHWMVARKAVDPGCTCNCCMYPIYVDYYVLRE